MDHYSWKDEGGLQQRFSGGNRDIQARKSKQRVILLVVNSNSLRVTSPVILIEGLLVLGDDKSEICLGIIKAEGTLKFN